MRRKLILSWSEAVVNEAGNLLTIFLFPFNKKRQARKNLFLVMNMAFADLLLGGVCLPLFFCVLATRNQFVLPAFLTIILTVSSQASFITTAALISGERFLRHLLALEPPNTFNASMQTCYLDGYPCFHDICSAILKPHVCVLFHLFYGLFLLVT